MGRAGGRRDRDDRRHLLNSLISRGKLQGSFEILFRLFWEHAETSRDKEITETAAPFFAFRGLVVASPLWYPNLSMDIRRRLFASLKMYSIRPVSSRSRVNEYCDTRVRYS